MSELSDLSGNAALSVPVVSDRSAPHLLDAVLRHSSAVVTVLGRDGSWRWSSGAVDRLIGFRPRIEGAQGVLDLLHPDDRASIRDAFSRAVEGRLRPDERSEVRLQVADGSWRTMEVHFDVLLDDPDVGGVVVYATDVTGRRRMLDELAASNQRLVELLSHMRVALLLEDERGAVVLANRAFVELFCIPFEPARLVGKVLGPLGLAPSRLVVEPEGAARRLADARRRHERVEGLQVVLCDGRVLECDVVPVVTQGADHGYVSAFRDVTRRVRAEVEQERLLASERDENRRLAEMDAYRSEAIAVVSHELRTPLTSIVGYTELLRETVEEGSSPEVEAWLDAIERNVGRILRLAGDVVALDSLESRVLALSLGPVDVERVLRHAERTVAPDAMAKSVTLELETAPGPPLFGDRERLAQLVENLVANAVKFTLPGGWVTVRAAPLAQGCPEGWEVTVADSGIGIPEDEVELVFSRFFRGSNASSRGVPGTGLGLSVVKAIAERHGGSVLVDSTLGVGTTVTVTLRGATEELGGPSI